MARPIHRGAIRTGLYDLDSMTGGIHPGDLILIASGEHLGVGPILLNNFVLAASSEGVPVAFIALTKSPFHVSLGLLAVRADRGGPHPLDSRPAVLRWTP
jgi:replicative DNA helicase